MRRLSSLLFLLLAAAPASAEEPGWIPFRLLGKVVMVEATINGHGPFLLIVDSGATETVLTPAVARQAGLRTWSATPDQRKGMARDIAVGSASVRDLPVFVFDPIQALPLRLDKGIDYGGMLGYTFLAAFTTTIDYPAHRLRFESVEKKSPTAIPPASQRLPAPMRGAPHAGTAGPNAKPQAVPFVLKDQLIHVPGTINGRGPLTFLLDTGSAEILVLPGTARRLGLNLLRADGGPGAPSAFSVLDEIAVGDTRVSGVTAVVGRLGWESPSGTTYDGIAGFPFLSNLVVTLNYRDRTLLLKRRAD